MSDELLYVLSRRGQVSWPTFRRYVQELAVRGGVMSDRLRYVEKITIRTMETLGYATVDFTDGSGVVRIAPRVLARLPVDGRPTAVLVGHRTTDTGQSLCDAAAVVPGASATVTDDDDEWPFIPKRLGVETDSAEDLARLADAVEARFDPDPAAWRILQFASTLELYRAALEWIIQRDLNWPRREFDPQAVRWVESDGAGDGLAEFTDPQTQRRHHRLRRGDRIATVDRTWGCYAALNLADRHIFSCTGDDVLVPLNARLPTPIDVGLAMCSGFAPRRILLRSTEVGPMELLRYRDVPKPLAHLAAGKVGQRIVLSPAHSEVRP